mmetsp:Transcript_1890/g.4819  ORF Transcript_1890/g.4819 Transcript_1890/m.4819 type:complete len:459 (+) Transcript_1890:70-1446(+)
MATDGSEGWPAERIFAATGSCGLREIAVLPNPTPARPAGVEVASKLTRNIDLQVPMIGGPRSEVVTVDMARALAYAGGIGFIHRDQPEASQAEMVKQVKNTEHGFILDPVTLGPYDMVSDVDQLKATRGCTAVPITDNRRIGGKLMGLVTARDVEGIVDRKATRLGTIMVPVKDLVVAQEPIAYRDAQTKMLREKVGKLPILNKDRELVALICRGDIRRQRDEPRAARDANRQLIVGASIAAAGSDMQRAEAVVTAGADVLQVEMPDGFSTASMDFIKQLRTSFPGVDVIVGDITSSAQAKAALDAGADGLRMGSPTNFQIGLSAASLLYNIATFARREYGIPVIADVKVASQGELLKAVCLGASACVVDELLRGSEEVPGKVVYGAGGLRYKSKAAFPQDSTTQMNQELVCKGSGKLLIECVASSLRDDLADMGMAGIPQLHQALLAGTLRMERCIA